MSRYITVQHLISRLPFSNDGVVAFTIAHIVLKSKFVSYEHVARSKVTLVHYILKEITERFAISLTYVPILARNLLLII